LTQVLSSYILKKHQKYPPSAIRVRADFSRGFFHAAEWKASQRSDVCRAGGGFGSRDLWLQQSPQTGKPGTKQESQATKTAAVGNGHPDRADSTSDLKRIIILENGNSPFWDAARAGLQDAEKELKLKQAGLRATLEVNDGTPGGQLEKLQQFNSQSDIVGVGVSALDADNVAVVEEMRKLQKKGVQVRDGRFGRQPRKISRLPLRLHRDR